MAYAALESMDEKHVSALGEANIAALMLRYSLPAIAATVVSATYNVVDRIFVGRACGEDALAAVTVCFSPSLFFLAIAMTIGQGSATMVSIRLGEGNREAAERILGQAVFLFAAFYVFAAHANRFCRVAAASPQRRRSHCHHLHQYGRYSGGFIPRTSADGGGKFHHACPARIF